MGLSLTESASRAIITARKFTPRPDANARHIWRASLRACRLGLTGNSTPNGLDPTPNKDRERVRHHRNHSDRSNPCAGGGRALHSLANTGHGEMYRRARTTPTTLQLLELRQAL